MSLLISLASIALGLYIITTVGGFIVATLISLVLLRGAKKAVDETKTN